MGAGTGSASDFGAVLRDGGIDVAVWAGAAEGVDLCLVGGDGERRIPLAQGPGNVFAGRVEGVGPGQRYGFRANGPNDPRSGLRCDPRVLLVDPYARLIVDGLAAVAEAPPAPAWPAPGVRDLAAGVVYELHVRSTTMRHPGVPEELRGTYLGLTQPAVLDHLESLGVTHVELMPVAASATEPAVAARGLVNHWGYSPLALLAPHERYAHEPQRAHLELREAVDALHARGIAVLLDVVLNHTCESGADLPPRSLRGLDDRVYLRDPADATRYLDVTGTGNTLDLGHPAVLRLALDALRHWCSWYGVDGFRFDLAVALARPRADGFDARAHFLTAIAQDPVLRDRVLIAEPWDSGAGGYQLGRFPAPFREWNGRYRDVVRDLWRGAPGALAGAATRMAGSSDLFAAGRRGPAASINFVTAHDGFTLRDLVTYEHKRNEANGEDNRDGTDDNRSWNCGVEGESDDPAIAALRARQQRNLLATLLLSQGVPMLLAGDELGRTQQGNNNAYCQDNEISWLDWEAADAALTAFVARLVGLRRAHPTFRRPWFASGQPLRDGLPDLGWLRPDGAPMTADDWARPWARAVALWLDGAAVDPADATFVLLLNASDAPVEFTLPAGRWEVEVDTRTADGAPGEGVPDDGPLVLVDRALLLLRLA